MTIFPDTSALSQALSPLVGPPGQALKIISRASFPESSTFPVEIITCEQADGRIVRLFGKYLAGKGPNNLGHRGGVEYEARVYMEILAQTDLSTIACFGKCIFPATGETLLALEYLGSDLRFTVSDDPRAIAKAASWSGAFHAIHEKTRPAFLTVYDKAYYTAWARRFASLSQELRQEFAWLDELLYYFVANIELLVNGSQTIVHGEYYPKNILLKDGVIYPVDWESAAIAAGEIDLASLIEGWDEEPAFEAVQAYRQARWPSGGDSLFEQRLLIARIYFYLWWWPDRIDSGKWKIQSYEFNLARQLAESAGIC